MTKKQVPGYDIHACALEVDKLLPLKAAYFEITDTIRFQRYLTRDNSVSREQRIDVRTDGPFFVMQGDKADGGQSFPALVKALRAALAHEAKEKSS